MQTRRDRLCLSILHFKHLGLLLPRSGHLPRHSICAFAANAAYQQAGEQREMRALRLLRHKNIQEIDRIPFDGSLSFGGSEGTKAEGYAKLDRTRLLLSARNLLGVRARAGRHKDFALEVEVRLALVSDHQTMGPPVLSRKIYIRTSSHSEIRAETCLSGDSPKPCGRSSCPLRSATVPVVIHVLTRSSFIHLFSYNAIAFFSISGPSIITCRNSGHLAIAQSGHCVPEVRSEAWRALGGLARSPGFGSCGNRFLMRAIFR